MDSFENLTSAVLAALARGPVYNIRDRGKNLYEGGEVARSLQFWIDDNKITTSEAAKRLGMSPSTIKAILAGERISDSMLARMLAPFGDSIRLRSRWRDVTAEDVQETISQVSTRLIRLRDLIRGSNSLNGENSPLDPIITSQIIALLEATLASIKAPYVEEPQTKGFFSWLKRVGKKAVEKGVEKEITDAIGSAGDSGAELLKKLSDLPGISDLDKIL
ncbi:helix-turn-helix domain-containing protein [Aquibium microcysteis]|uniref:helix-turn-helix domain-containing protein n=1 Tax=Aquibium microcysteis TaxID=675281 RepID=UPI00165D1EB6|nr:helix-turn-helix transcriptional regulator [Aquibium microcysteis]